ncbi:MAG TPA: hypothetical protein VF303_00295 [Candidatus Nanoarchaeia archaeon]
MPVKRLKGEGRGSKGRRRIQFDFSETDIRRLQEILAMTEHVSFADVVREEGRIYHEIIQRTRDGWELIMRHPETGREMLLLTTILMAVKADVGRT